MKNSGKSYELLTQWIYQQLLDYQNKGYRKIEVQHDILLLGKTGVEHQVDIYWEFELAGVMYKTIIEVKDWQTKVKKEHIMGFKEKLNDIASFPCGIFVSKSGFQSGAIEYARVHGIKLVTIDETNTMNHLYINYKLRFPHIEKLSIILDKKWLTLEKENKGLLSVTELSRRVSEAILCDGDQNQEPLLNFIRQAQKSHLDDDPGVKSHIIYKFEKPWYILTGDENIPKALLKGFEFDFFITESQEHQEFHPDEAVDYLLRDLLEGTQIGFNSVHGVVNID